MGFDFNEIEVIKNNQFNYIKQLSSIDSARYQDITPLLRGFIALCNEQSLDFHFYSAEKAVSSRLLGTTLDTIKVNFSCEKYLITNDNPYKVDWILNRYKKYFSYLEKKANGRSIIINVLVPFVFEQENIYLYGYYMFLDKGPFIYIS